LKKNPLLKKYTSLIPSKDPDNIGSALKLNWMKIYQLVFFHSLIPLILKVIQKFLKEGKKTILVIPNWKAQILSPLLQDITISKINLGKEDNIPVPGKNMMRRDMHLPPGKLEPRLLMNFLNLRKNIYQ
jgi:hypothetical protein